MAGRWREISAPTLHVVNVVGRVPMVVYGAEAYSASIPELQQEIEDSARAQLADLSLATTSRLPTQVGDHVGRARPARSSTMPRASGWT